jgi:hypothetical protein
LKALFSTCSQLMWFDSQPMWFGADSRSQLMWFRESPCSQLNAFMFSASYN